ncbi:mitochondrial ribosome assembly protein RRG9 ASCRUDRAFT_5660 [Ascoidea rubescens DSM 1968]|uniref:Required for respiratory growth protein 9, mitochondrial n=1 Tax=Ascoidea rubescens DSM 1968 TaxID=1344418 RepID=A0A1D2VQ79_9ASCO|nr:hypothetical protein ASCRUDRAFT_5660 [Ascoidea rubescens DSM 1968]ODV63715.1 hypothetical protein ASCRUDRAFT_5660 [Ascoidea rubescens DSM 1968]
MDNRRRLNGRVRDKIYKLIKSSSSSSSSSSSLSSSGSGSPDSSAPESLPAKKNSWVLPSFEKLDQKNTIEGKNTKKKSISENKNTTINRNTLENDSGSEKLLSKKKKINSHAEKFEFVNKMDLNKNKINVDKIIASNNEYSAEEILKEKQKLKRLFKNKSTPEWMKKQLTFKIKLKNERWNPQKKLSREQMEMLRTIKTEDPSVTVKELSKLYGISPESVTRILKSKWRPTIEEENKQEEKRRKRLEEYHKIQSKTKDRLFKKMEINQENKPGDLKIVERRYKSRAFEPHKKSWRNEEI